MNIHIFTMREKSEIPHDYDKADLWGACNAWNAVAPCTYNDFRTRNNKIKRISFCVNEPDMFWFSTRVNGFMILLRKLEKIVHPIISWIRESYNKQQLSFHSWTSKRTEMSRKLLTAKCKNLISWKHDLLMSNSGVKCSDYLNSKVINHLKTHLLT